MDELHGIDLDADPGIVTKILRERGKESTLRHGSVYELPYADDEFDLVVCFSVFEHLSDTTRALREVHRVMRPGGLFLIGMPAVNRMMEAAFLAIGFRGIDDHHVTTPLQVAREAETSFELLTEKHFDFPLPRLLGARLYYDLLLGKRLA